MNKDSVISLPIASGTAIAEYLRVYVDSNGQVLLAGATDPAIGHLERPCDGANYQFASVYLINNGGVHFAVANAAISKGGKFQPAASGKIAPLTTGTPSGIALEAAAADGNVIRVAYIGGLAGVPFDIVTAGIHSWAGGAATTDSIAVTGLAAGDVVVASLAARASTETLVLVANDHANDQIDLTLSANGTNTTTKIHYVVLRQKA